MQCFHSKSLLLLWREEGGGRSVSDCFSCQQPGKIFCCSPLHGQISENTHALESISEIPLCYWKIKSNLASH